MDDPKIKAVHEDIAREEIVHFGEFLRMLYEVSPDDFQYVNKGWEEASKNIGTTPKFPIEFTEKQKTENINLNNDIDLITQWINAGLTNRITRTIANIISWKHETIPVYEIGRNKDEIVQGKLSSIYEIPHISLQFKISLQNVTHEEMKRIAIAAGNTFASLEDSLLLKEHPLSPIKFGTILQASDWSQPGNIAEDIIKAFEVLSKEGFIKELYILLSPSVYSKLFRIIDRTGTYELELVKEIGKIVTTNVLENEIILVSKLGFDILIVKDTQIELLAKEREHNVYLVSEQIAPYLLSKSAACVIKA